MRGERLGDGTIMRKRKPPILSRRSTMDQNEGGNAVVQVKIEEVKNMKKYQRRKRTLVERVVGPLGKWNAGKKA